MRILVTGAEGQLGHEFIKQLDIGGCELGEIPSSFAGAKVKGVDIGDYDLTDASAVDKNIGAGGYDIVINCAAFTNVDACESQPDTAHAANAAAPRNIAAACEKTGAKLVHISTDYVFSGDADTPYTEDMPTEPNSVYGTAKLAGEIAVRETCRRHFIARTQWLYGQHGKNFVKTIMNAARENGEVKVVDDQYGCPTNAVDLAYFLLAMAAGESYGTYHCVNSGVTSWYGFTREIIKLADIGAAVTPCTTEEFPRPAPRPAYSALDNSKLTQTVGIAPRSWHDAIASYLKNKY